MGARDARDFCGQTAGITPRLIGGCLAQSLRASPGRFPSAFDGDHHHTIPPRNLVLVPAPASS